MRARMKLYSMYALIMVMFWALLGIAVYGGNEIDLINDTGSSTGSWENVINKVASASSLDGGPSSGYPGSFYYFRTSGGSRAMSDAVISRVVALNADQKTLCSLEQLKVNFSLDYFGWDDDDGDYDYFVASIYSIKANGKFSTIHSTNGYDGNKAWRALNIPEKLVPKDTVKIQVVITAFRESGDDLDVYLDNILLTVIDDNQPVMTNATVTEIRDWQNNLVPLNTDKDGNYLDNWVNTEDTIIGKIEFNEPVYVSDFPVNLNTNILNKDGGKVYADIGSSYLSYSNSYDYSIPFSYKDRMGEGDSIVKFVGGTYGLDPFNIPVRDLGGNQGLAGVENNIDVYKIKLDSAPPVIITPEDSYETYVKDRSTVDIVVREEDGGREQSPLTMTYFWEYRNNSDLRVIEPEKEIRLSKDTAVILKDGTNTTYTVTIEIPNEGEPDKTFPDCQEFWLYAEVNDEARNPYGNNIIYSKVNQKDSTPPVITWNKSVLGNGTIVDLNMEEDTDYAKSRTISFSAEDLESGMEEVRYLWTREGYNVDSNDIRKMVLPDGEGKYVIEATNPDAPLEGLYYLNILAANTTGTGSVIRKGFNFDNEAPRVSGDVIYAEEKPVSAQYQVKDRALQNKFLYTVQSIKSEGLYEFDPVDEPDLSEGLMDNGMWKVLDLEGAGEERTASITGVLDKITESGYYNLVTRYYDEYYNCQEIERTMWYDFEPPMLEVIYDGEPNTYKKNHNVILRIFDEISGVKLYEDKPYINWIDADSEEVIPATYSIEPQSEHITVSGSEDFDGKYYLKVKREDYAGNIAEERLSIGAGEGSIPIEFCFDNSPPEVTLACDTDKAVNKVVFEYSDLKDAYSTVGSFQYGISNSADIEPLEWIDIDTTLTVDNITYPNNITEDGEWYLFVKLKDNLENEKIIRYPEPFRIDTSEPAGKIGFEKAYTNKLEVPLKLEIDELKTVDSKTFKTILSGNRGMIEDAAIAGALSTDWNDIVFEKGVAITSFTISEAENVAQSVYVRFMDEVGNISPIYDDTIILDRTAPTGEITYDHDLTVPTNENVTATITMTDASPVNLLNNNQVSSYVFNRNGEFEFVFKDEAGNKNHATAVINNIDEEPPIATITYSHPRDVWTNQSIIATLKLTDENGYAILGDGTSTYVFNDNGEHIFLYKDSLDNQSSIKAEVKNIDKAPPVGSIIYNTYSETAPVTVYLDVYEPVKVTNNNGSFRYVFDNNGSFTFEFEDKAGNPGSKTAEANTIDSLEEYINVTYSDEGKLTNENINASFEPFSGLSIITGPTVIEEVYGVHTHSFTENGEWPVNIKVLSGEEAGEIRTVGGSVHNIDRVTPKAEVYFSTNEPTNQNITATLLTYDDKGKTITIINNNGESEHVFEGNGTFTFEFVDEAGNRGDKAVTVTNIDKTVPIAVVSYFTEESKTNSKFAEISFREETGEITILNNNGSNIFEFVENGAFTFKYSDKAGNEGTVTAQVTGLSDSVSAGIIEYYIDGIKVADPNAKEINKSVTAKLVLDEASGPYTIVNNGGRSTYTFEQNGEFTFIYEDSRKNRGFATAKVIKIDKEVPELQILADIVKATRENVSITVTYSDDKGISKVALNGEEWEVLTGNFTFICTENKTIQVKIIDTAGNETYKEFNVNNIDREAPIGTIVYIPSNITNQDVSAVLKLNEPGNVLNNNGKPEYIFIENDTFTFEFEDNAGNKGSIIASVNWIDKIPPKGSLEYSNTSMSSNPVVVTLKADSDAIILNNGRMPNRTFYTNGYFTFKITDAAGNVVNLKAEVWNIDEEKPQLTLTGNSYECILQNGAYTEAGYKAFDNIDGDITDKVVVEGSVNSEIKGIYKIRYKVSDAVGNIAEETRTVKVIGSDEIVLLINGKVADSGMILLDKRNVTVSALGNEGSYVIKWGEGKRTQAYFKGNGNTIAAGRTLLLEAGRWYTFFIQDRERRVKSVQIYINE